MNSASRPMVRYSRRMTGEEADSVSWLTNPIVEDLNGGGIDRSWHAEFPSVDPTSLIVQCSEIFCLVDAKGIGIYAYDRRSRCEHSCRRSKQPMDGLCQCPTFAPPASRGWTSSLTSL